MIDWINYLESNISILLRNNFISNYWISIILIVLGILEYGNEKKWTNLINFSF